MTPMKPSPASPIFMTVELSMVQKVPIHWLVMPICLPCWMNSGMGARM